MVENVKLLKQLVDNSEGDICDYLEDHDCFRSRQAAILGQLILELEARITKLERTTKPKDDWDPASVGM